MPTIEDTWGVVTLEVMLFGKAVLCSVGAGSSELVIDGENGYVFEPTQSEKLAQMMQKFIDCPIWLQLWEKNLASLLPLIPRKGSRIFGYYY